MILEKMDITKFRGFNNQNVDFGQVNIIVGQNGTQKTTLMGMITSVFTNKSSYFSGQKTLLNKSFSYNISEIIKFSVDKENIKESAWTMHSELFEAGKYDAKLIWRDKEKELIRIWTDSKEKGSGFARVPIIYLSLGRLTPVAETDVMSTEFNEYIDKEMENIQYEYKKILSLSHEKEVIFDGFNKGSITTFGMKSNEYDFKSVSAGQDNLAQIILSMFSFKYLKEKFPSEYKGGILILDEMESTLHPTAQIKLLNFLVRYSSRFNIQLFFTTHSNNIVNEYMEHYIKDPKVKLIYLEKENKEIKINSEPDRNIINYALTSKAQKEIKQSNKCRIIKEDAELEFVAKCILRKYVKLTQLEFEPFSLGCSNIIELNKKIPYFKNSIILLDADARNQIRNTKNILCIPGDVVDSPERTLYLYLKSLSDDDELWDKSYFSREHVLNMEGGIDIEDNYDRNKAKMWFNEVLKYDRSKLEKAVTDCYFNAYKEDTVAFIKLFVKKTNVETKKAYDRL